MSNNLGISTEALVWSGLDPNEKAQEADLTPIKIFRRHRTIKILMAMQRFGHYDLDHK